MNLTPICNVRVRSSALLTCVLGCFVATPTFAQFDVGGTVAAAPTRSDATLTRDADGNVIVRATRVSQSITIDGYLDEAVYEAVEPITEFIQQEPHVGAPMTEKTEAWVLFDDDNIYIVCRCWDQHPERIIANDMRRDSSNLSDHDNFTVVFDTFHDGRSGYMLYLTAIGAIRDGAVVDSRADFEWNPIWDGKVSRFDGGWISEMAFPFKSLRYGPGREQTWGLQLRRSIASKNEVAYITPVDPQWGNGAITHLEAAATLTGLEAPPPARNLEIKPYAISRLTTDLLQSPTVRNKIEPDAGFDVKYGVTQALTADFTYNTDFAQVEADEAQVNLTRFNLSFPEKRDFFIEGQGIFQFGAGVGDGRGSSDTPILFYSRRIGLQGSRVIPVIAGGRLTGKAGPWTLGALNISTDDDTASRTPKTNFTVMRLRRDVFQASTVGALFTRRSTSVVAPGDNTLWGVDGAFLFYRNLNLGGYVAKTQTSDRAGDDLSYRGQLDYTVDRYGLAFDRIVVEKNFNPEVGFLRRRNFRRNYAQAQFTPRTTDNPLIRRFTYQGSFEYTTDNNNRLETREAQALFGIDFHNADRLTVQHSQLYEYLPELFEIASDIVLPVGGYGFHNTRVNYDAGVSHRVTGSTRFETGSFYTGDKITTAFRGRVEVTSRLGVEPNISFNWVDLPEGKFTDTVVGGRAFFSMSPRSFVAALIQYSSSTTSLSTNLRFRWEYRPGSEMFVVYTEGRSTRPAHGIPLENRGLVVKINRLFRF